MISIKKRDKRAKRVIALISVVLLAAIVLLDKHVVDVPYPFGFDVHVFAFINAVINSCVASLLIAAYVSVRKKRVVLHKYLMLLAIVLSVLFLVTYVLHHLWAGDTKFGGTGMIRYVYYFILLSHILLAAISLPFILFTAYRGLTAAYDKHKKIARYTFPIWLYIAVTGPVIYIMIYPYY